MVILRLLLIVALVFVTIGIISYCLELSRYISYLEKKLENYQFDNLNDSSQNKQGH